jgi:Fur family ferric uptake transcriptional regulator
MTVAHSGPAVVVDDVEGAATIMRSRGLRVSTARRVVLEVLFAAREPVRAERIAGGLDGRFPTSELGSVYRNLEMLERVGLVRHLHLGHGPGLYALADDRPREYLLCEECGAVRTVVPAQLDRVRRSIRERFGYTARISNFPIVGSCATCTAARNDADAGAA